MLTNKKQDHTCQFIFRTFTLRGDGLGLKLGNDADSFMTHTNCIKTYCSKEHIQRFVAKRQHEHEQTLPVESAKKRLRGKDSFNFLVNCLFCGEKCLLERDKKHPDRWREAYLCRTADRQGKTTFKQSILAKASERDDEWARDVIIRVNGAVSDLHAADGRYHKDCHAKFFSNSPPLFAIGMHDQALEIVKQSLIANRKRIWNSVT